MQAGLSAYSMMVFVHLMLFVIWLGGDIGVFLLGQNFRKRDLWMLDQRLAILKMLVLVDLAPRIAWALMVPVTLSVVTLGKWWDVGVPGLIAAWAASLLWLSFILVSHRGKSGPAMTAAKHAETYFKLIMIGFYLWIGIESWLTMEPLAPRWLAMKAILFGLIFLAAMMIDVRFKPVGPLLQKLVAEGSSDATEVPLLATMNRTRRWVLTIYLLLIVTAFLGSVKPF